MLELAQLAIMSKAATVFATEKTFLSFPITPLAFDPAELDLDLADAANIRGIDNLIAFSEVVNRMPGGIAWDPDADQHLWNPYGRLLREGDFALSDRTPAEEAEYRAACAVLYSVAADGVTRTPTTAADAYRQRRDAQVVASEEYRGLAATVNALAASISADVDATTVAELSASTALRDRAKTAVDDALDDWVRLGFKTEIEQADATVQSLGARSPALTRAEWAARIDPNTATLTRASDGLEVYPTSFSPGNALVGDSWRPMSITGAEIADAVAAAPAEMRQRFDADGSSTDLVSIGFEFSSAALVRPWFDSDALTSSFWKFPDGSLLSDGGTPATGPCTAYTAAVVFARRITAVPRTPPPSGEPPRRYVPRFDLAQLADISQVVVQPNLVTRVRVPEQYLQQATGVSVGAALEQPVPMRSANSRFAAGALLIADSPAISELQTMSITRQSVGVAALSRLHAEASPQIFHTLVADRFTQIAPLADAKQFDVGQIDVVPPILDPAPDSAEPAAAEDTVFIVAFICKPVGLAPDPAPGLQW